MCIGASSLFQRLLQDALARLDSLLSLDEPYSLHIPLVEAIVSMYDVSVWSVRDVVRGVEKAGPIMTMSKLRC